MTPLPTRPRRAADPDASGSSGGVAVLDAGALERLRELDPDGSRGFMAQVLRTYEAALRRHLGRLADVDGVPPAAKMAGEVAHTLKSSSASIGALDFSACCAQLERTAKTTGVEGDIMPALAAVRAEGERVLAAVRAMLQE